MKKQLIASIIIFTFAFLFSQSFEEHKSIHQIEWEAHLNDPEQHVFYKNSVVSVDPLQQRDPNGPQLTHAVFGYLPDWKYTSAPQYFDYSVLSHIALFDFTVSTAGNITGYPSGWPDNWLNMMNTAHANGTKLIMCIVEFNDDDIHAIINSSTASNNFYQNVANILTTYNLDGVNIDFEGPQIADRGAPMNSFMQGLTNYIKTNVGSEQEISFAGPAVNWSGWDLPGLVNACDYVFIMGYAYWYNGSSVTGPSAPITGASINLEQTLNNSDNGYGSCDKSKIILGLPYYGNKWKVSYSQRSTVNATTLATGSSVVYATAKDYYANYGRQWSTKYEDAWTYYQSGDDWYQAWCNDAQALDAKEKLVFTYGLMGTGMWALGYDEEHNELWEVLRENFLEFEDSLMLDNFEDGLGHFYRQPDYSGSCKGISSESWSDTSSETSYIDEHSLKIVLKDDTSSSEDWKIRLLSGQGTPGYNVQFPRTRELHFALRTNQSGMEVAVLIDDGISELESSLRLAVLGDNNWHTYSVRLDSAELWTNYYNGDGAINTDYITLDALMFYAPQQLADRIVYLDAVEALAVEDPIEPGIEILPQRFQLYPNYPNPFNSSTTLHYAIPENSDVNIELYSINGRRVSTLINAYHTAGDYRISWNSNTAPSGIYIAVMQVNGHIVSSQKLMLVK
ncbi:MAG: T9SS type A sorting domain-containing protein [Candidatus Marinimicrobia bacterium]|nr:T9SS type A sorting domain-containing protein [Candidatus Neomarinimicrobiota bacterium]